MPGDTALESSAGPSHREIIPVAVRTDIPRLGDLVARSHIEQLDRLAARVRHDLPAARGVARSAEGQHQQPADEIKSGVYRPAARRGPAEAAQEAVRAVQIETV